jgi:hypothetical protein
MFFFINAIKKICEKYMLLKQLVLIACQGTHVTLICGLYEISVLTAIILIVGEHKFHYPNSILNKIL